MKIGIFSDIYLPTPTGISVAVESLRKGLENTGHQVCVFAPEYPKYKDRAINIYRLPANILPNAPEIPLAKPVNLGILSEINKLSLDLLHTFSVGLIGNLGLKASKKLKIPCVHSFYPSPVDFGKYSGKISKIFGNKAFLNRQIQHANQSSLLVVPSPSAKKLALNLNIIPPIQIVPTGIDTSAYVSLPPDTMLNNFEIPKGRKIILYVGRLDEESNFRFLLRAFANVVQKVEQAHLLVIGKGPQGEIFQKIVNHQAFADNVTFAQFMPRAELAKVYGACDIYAFPAPSATQAITIIEALASGLPVVAINRFAPADIIRDNEDGYLSPLNEKQFSDKIIYLLQNDKLRNHFSVAARINAKRFDINATTKHIIKIYEELV